MFPVTRNVRPSILRIMVAVLSFWLLAEAAPARSEQLSVAGRASHSNVASILLGAISGLTELELEGISAKYVSISDGNGKALVDEVTHGRFDIGILTLREIIDQFDEKQLVFTSLVVEPFTFPNTRSLFQVQDSVYGDIVLSEIGRFGILPLGFWNHTQSQLLAKRKIESIDDLKGMKIATQQKDSYSTIAAIGASPVTTTMSYSEVYSALQRGVIDAAESGFFENSDYYRVYYPPESIITNYRSDAGVFVVGTNAWMKWSESKRRAVRKAIRVAETTLRKEILLIESEREDIFESLGVNLENIHSLGGLERVRNAVRKKWMQRVGDGGSRAIEFMKRALDGMLPNSLQIDESEQQRGGIDEATIYFATDRPDSRSSDLSNRFGVERSSLSEISCGTAVFKRNSQRELGDRFDGDLWILNNGEVIKDLNCIQFFSSSAKSRDGNVTIFIHGYWNSFESSVRRAIGVAQDLRVIDELVLWSWPSLGVRGGYFYDEESVVWSSLNFRGFLKELLQRREISSVDVVAHSMGSRIALDSLLLGISEIEKIRNIVFVAPDVASDIFVSVVANYAKIGKIRTLYASRNDRALQVSEGIHGSARAGTGGSSIVVIDKLDSIDATLVEEAWGLNHNHALQIPEALGDLRSLLSSLRSASERGLTRAERDGLSFWLIQPEH